MGTLITATTVTLRTAIIQRTTVIVTLRTVTRHVATMHGAITCAATLGRLTENEKPPDEEPSGIVVGAMLSRSETGN